MSRVRQIKGASMRDAKARIAKMGVVGAQRVARAAAPALTSAARSDFDSGRTAYGDARPTGVNGDRLSLVRTGATRSLLGFSAQGTAMRAVLSTAWAKYLVGKYRILPIGDRSAIPSKWRAAIDRVMQETLDRVWREAA